jgi:hypothetical protein
MSNRKINEEFLGGGVNAPLSKFFNTEVRTPELTDDMLLAYLEMAVRAINQGLDDTYHKQELRVKQILGALGRPQWW